jgi:Flp pilus assembly protein TadG
MNSTTRSEEASQRGAVAVIVGIMMVVLLGSTALAVDLGAKRATDGRVVTAADASALTAAQKLSQGLSTSAACNAARAMVTANEPGSTMTSCTVGTTSSGQNIVTVDVTAQVPFAFAPVIGFDSGTARAEATARWGELGVVGARPFALCMPVLQGLLDSWTSASTSAIGPVTVPYGKGSQTASCTEGGGVPGNWGTLDFDGGSNGTPDQIDWITNGYSGTLYPDTWIEGDPGALSNSVSGALDSLVASGTIFPIPLFNSATGSGANAQFEVIGFVDAQLIEYDVTGNASGRSLTLVFHPGRRPGVPCCNPSASSAVVVASGICAVNDETDAC